MSPVIPVCDLCHKAFPAEDIGVRRYVENDSWHEVIYWCKSCARRELFPRLDEEDTDE